MDTFLALPPERQNEIINISMGIFARLGYKKTSTSDIAAAIGVSKGMIFRYFGTKKNLYAYLVNCACDLMIQAFQSNIEPANADFFARIMAMIQVKISVLTQHSSMLGFLGSAYSETDKEVVESMKLLLSRGESMRNELVLTDVDRHKFKDTVNPVLLQQMLVKIGEGYAGAAQDTLDLDEAIREFSAFITMLKQNLYKEEYL